MASQKRITMRNNLPNEKKRRITNTILRDGLKI